MQEEQLIGSRVERREDISLIQGTAKYTGDFVAPDLAHAAVLRSQYGHAVINDIDPSEAKALDGVLAVYTAADLDDVPGVIGSSGSLPGQRSTELPLLARDKVRYTGEAVVLVIAEDRYTARDAIDLIDVDYERLDSVTDPRAALEEEAPVIQDQWSDNVAFDWSFGDEPTIERAFADADHVVALDLDNQRLVPDPMEPRSVFADYDPSTRTLTVRVSTQKPHVHRSGFADLLGISEDRIRVIAPAVGGGFGTKGDVYADEALVAWSSTQLERPVRWVATRTEEHRTSYQGRDMQLRGELAFDGHDIIGLRVTGRVSVGAYLTRGAIPARNMHQLLSGQYTIPAIGGRIVGVFTNTAPTGPYRGAGRPEAVYLHERLMKHAATELDVDPAELRRQNQIPADAFPYETPTGAIYDSGDYGTALDLALEEAGYDNLRRRQRSLREDGRYLGVGLSCFVEDTGSSPGSNPESGRVAFSPEGEVTAYCGTADHGQGHGTTFSQLLSDRLGVPYDDIEIREGDTADLAEGTGTFGSRSAAVGGSVLAECADKVIEQAKRIAAHHLEADEADVSFEDGECYIEGARDRSIHIQEVASIAHSSTDLPAGVDPGLEAEATYDPENYAYSFGTHVAVVEVDPASGEVDIQRYVAIDDCGVPINPTIIEGQIQGGVAQGIGQALYEEAIYDDAGSLVTGSLQDYALPKATSIPAVEIEETVTPCPHNPLGVKGAGESGTIGAPPAIANAVVDALIPFGVEHIDTPITSERVWRAIH